MVGRTNYFSILIDKKSDNFCNFFPLYCNFAPFKKQTAFLSVFTCKLR
ncbi:hypothetical protein HMPREF3226_01336 [Prevotella corporis]|uniref:Uncharacterized protein n=1 Tax=Prevotella corporis TaxID=28128 RepID=A0A133Q9C9_9BACT|nr:hypothetical protein HMPREF3226_01336 [Prevotella corporis]